MLTLQTLLTVAKINCLNEERIRIYLHYFSEVKNQSGIKKCRHFFFRLQIYVI